MNKIRERLLTEKGQDTMKLKLGTDDIFNCPEGHIQGILETTGEPKKRVNKPCETQVRLKFRVRTSEGREHLVARTFCATLEFGSELYCFLESWLDGKFDAYLDDNGEIDLNLLIGKSANLYITHFEDGKHAHPYVHIAGIFPADRLN